MDTTFHDPDTSASNFRLEDDSSPPGCGWSKKTGPNTVKEMSLKGVIKNFKDFLNNCFVYWIVKSKPQELHPLYDSK